MSRVIHYVELYNYTYVWNQTDSKSSTRIMFNTVGNKPLCNEKRIWRYGYSYRGTSQIRTSNFRKM